MSRINETRFHRPAIQLRGLLLFFKFAGTCVLAVSFPGLYAQQTDWQKASKQIGKLEAEGRYPEALATAEQNLRLAEDSFGASASATATSLIDLGGVDVCMGKYSEAESLYQRGLALREKSLGPDHPEVASALNELGVLYG
jgi:tetratricopeptide (TPR) repeat protein